MSTVLMLEERCRNTIQLGESHFREFKSALEGRADQKRPRLVKKICQDIAEALVAFANADGGELLIGVDDDGTISGVPHGNDDIALMLAAPQTHVHHDSSLPMSMAARITLDGHVVLFFSVAKGTTEIYQLPDGRCMRRKDRNTIPEAFRRIQFERQEIRSREYDRSFVDGASVGDLEIPLVQSIANGYLAGLSVELYLQQVGLAEYSSAGLRLRMAALLLFAKDVQRWHPRSQVRILNLTPRQRRIVVLGMDGRKISQDDIYDAMNTDDRDTYDREVTALRLLGILPEARSNTTASRIAKARNIPKGKVARFAVVSPAARPEEPLPPPEGSV
jgi:ATP-dependent DNA helicase RecG